MEREPTIKDVMGTLNDLAEAVNKGFQGVQEQLGGVNTRLDGVEGRLTNVEGRLTNVERRMDTEMVTKDYLDRRTEKTDAKINMLVHVLAEKRVLNDADRQAIRLA